MEFVDLKEVISEKYTFYAHVDGERKETLQEHTLLCQKYFKELVEKKQAFRSIVYLENELFSDLGETGRRLIEKMFVNVVSFHDFGKCNPLFQGRKMGNYITKQTDGFDAIASQHSILSAVLYLDYFFYQLEQIKSEVTAGEFKKLKYLVLINAFVIARHHSDLCSVDDFLELFEEDGNGYYCVDGLRNNGKEMYRYQLKQLEIKKEKGTEAEYVKETPKWKKIKKCITEKESILYYIYTRLLYSLLVASDYYATSEFSQGKRIVCLGEREELLDFTKAFKETERYQKIKKYEESTYHDEKKVWKEMSINDLRTELYIEAERERKKNKEKGIYYLEAPTGSGKSNTAFGLSFQMAEEEQMDKIFYVYPFNTLVEQNQVTLDYIFKENEEIRKKIAVINSVTPMLTDEKKRKEIEKRSAGEGDDGFYQEVLLNRQFLNYPMVLTTSVSLFHCMFREKQEDVMEFYQLLNSVIVLDEIQSYKNTIWAEMIRFFQVFSKMLHIKIIIMSATLPNFTQLLKEDDKVREGICSLILDRKKYFGHHKFCERVEVNLDLLQVDNIEESLFQHVKEENRKKKKILIEFIKKETAEKFYQRLVETYENGEIIGKIELMTGDTNRIERKEILSYTKSEEVQKEGMILVATQVVEAGVDIDMDIGYKDTSILDSEEQFMGRINRSCLREGIVYFFNWDGVTQIYKNDFRTNFENTIFNEEIQKIFIQKDFPAYYQRILKSINQFIHKGNDNNIEVFFHETVGGLDFPEIAQRMELIEEDNWKIPVFLAREINLDNGERLLGMDVWKAYKALLQDNEMTYPKKQVLLSDIQAKMDYFIYDVKKGSDIVYQDRIGEMYLIEDGEEFFENNKFSRKKLEQQRGLSCD